MAFWRWFAFSQGGICIHPLEGTLQTVADFFPPLALRRPFLASRPSKGSLMQQPRQIWSILQRDTKVKVVRPPGGKVARVWKEWEIFHPLRIPFWDDILKSIPNWIPSGKLDWQMDWFTLWYLFSSFKILCAQFVAETSKFHLLPFPSGQIISTSHDLGPQLWWFSKVNPLISREIHKVEIVFQECVASSPWTP